MTVIGKREFSAREWVKTLLLVVGLVAAAGVVICAAMYVMVLVAMRAPKVDLREFNSEQWKAASNTDASLHSVRLRMAAISIDSEWLVLKLTDGVVTDARLARD